MPRSLWRSQNETLFVFSGESKTIFVFERHILPGQTLIRYIEGEIAPFPSMEARADVSPSVACQNVPEPRLPTREGPDSFRPAVRGAVPSPVFPWMVVDDGSMVAVGSAPSGVARPGLSVEEHNGRDNSRTSALHPQRHLRLHLGLHPWAAAKCRAQNEIGTERARRRYAAKTRMRRERPHPWTHGASRVPWGRSRLVTPEA